MISIQAFGGSFGALGSYLETGENRVDPSQRVGWMEFRNLPTRRMDVAVPIMRGTASLSSTQQPVFHLSISWAPGDPVNRELMYDVMVQTLSDLGLHEHQAVIVSHIDTDDPHVHAMVNRVHPETGVAWKGSWSKLRAEASLRRQELERGLRVVPGWLARVPGAPELRPQPRIARGDAEFLREVQERAGPVLERAQSWSELEAGLSEFGLSVRVNGRGMSVTDGRQEVKASQVGRLFSRGNLEERMGRYSDYSARVAVATAEAARGQADAPATHKSQKAATRVEDAAPELHPRFRLYEDSGRFGVWDCVGPQLFFAETREQALAEAQRASKIVARYPNIVAVRSLAAVDASWRAEHGLDAVPAPGRRWVEMPSPAASSSELAATPDASQSLEAVRGEAAAPESAHQLSLVPTEEAVPPVPTPARRQRKARKSDPQVSHSQQDDLWSQPPALTENGVDITEPAVEQSASAQVEGSDAPSLIFPIDGVPAGVSSPGAVSTPERPEPAKLDSKEAPEAQPIPHPWAGAEPLVPAARPRQRKAKPSRARSDPEAQADLWSQAPAPAEATAPAPAQEEVTAPDLHPLADRAEEVATPAEATYVEVESAAGVVLTRQATPTPGLPVSLEPVAASEPLPHAEQVEEAVAPAESVLDPSPADIRSEVARRIENIRRMNAASRAEIAYRQELRQVLARGDAATPTDDSLASQSSRASIAGRDEIGPATGRDRRRAASDPPGAPPRHPSDRLVRDGGVRSLRDSMPLGGRPELEKFLRMADRVLEQKARQAEIEDALTDISNGSSKWRFDLDRVDSGLRGGWNDFHEAVNSTFRDPQEFWNWYKSLSEGQQRKMLETLRDSPAAFAYEFLARPASEIATAGERPPARRTVLARIAKRLRREKPERRVFLNVRGFERDSLLTAGAGLRCMDAVQVHAAAYRSVAGKLGMPHAATPKEVREEMAAHVERAMIRKAEAIERHDALGRVPTTKELRRAFRGLSLEDRRWVQQQLHLVAKVIPKALSLAVQLAEGPERQRGGWSL